MYTDPSHPAGFSTPERLKKATKESTSKVTEFLQSQDSYTLHAPARRRFPRNVTYADTVDDCWQSDLADFQSLQEDNNGFLYLLCIIDVFSKYAWVVPLKNKTANSVINGFQSVFDSSPRRPGRVITDKGKEFNNTCFKNFLKKLGIHYYHTNNPVTKASVCERFQRTLKSNLFKIFTHRDGEYSYIDGTLQQVLHAYNNRYHRSIKMTPTEASSPDRVLQVYDNLYGKRPLRRSNKPPKFKVGDFVRISREKKRFEKGYTWNWSYEIFQIDQVISHPVHVYKIRDLTSKNEIIEGHFMEKELQKVTKPDFFKIQYIVRTKGKGPNLQHLVHWRGYPTSGRSWIFARDIVES